MKYDSKLIKANKIKMMYVLFIEYEITVFILFQLQNLSKGYLVWSCKMNS